jgi:hypothetical protein
MDTQPEKIILQLTNGKEINAWMWLSSANSNLVIQSALGVFTVSHESAANVASRIVLLLQGSRQ